MRSIAIDPLSLPPTDSAPTLPPPTTRPCSLAAEGTPAKTRSLLRRSPRALWRHGVPPAPRVRSPLSGGYFYPRLAIYHDLPSPRSRTLRTRVVAAVQLAQQARQEVLGLARALAHLGHRHAVQLHRALVGEAVEAFDGPREQLRDVEQWLLSVKERLPRFSGRAKCLTIKVTFKDTIGELARLVALPQPRRCYDQQAATAELGPRAGRRVGGDAHRGGRRVLLQHHDR